MKLNEPVSFLFALLYGSFAFSQNASAISSTRFALTDNQFPGVFWGSTEFSDVDADGDADLLLNGTNESMLPYTGLFLNDGSGNYTEDNTNAFIQVYYGDVKFVDLDADGDEDLFIAGHDGVDYRHAFYSNDGTGSFQINAACPLRKVRGTVRFEELNNDGYPDLIISGIRLSETDTTSIYFNDGTGCFYPSKNPSFQEFDYGSISLIDFDGDSDNDILITGLAQEHDPMDWSIYSSTGTNGQAFINNGSGQFTEMNQYPFPSVSFGDVIVEDLDNDSDEDLFFMGISNVANSQGYDRTALLLNENGSFVPYSNNAFQATRNGSCAASDVDMDGDKDLLLTAWDAYSERPYTALYIQENGNFRTDIPFELSKLYLGTTVFRDVNGDGREDLLISGQDTFGRYRTELYLNNPDTVFHPELLTSLDLKVYPNPARNTLTIESRGFVFPNVKLFAADGRLLHQFEMNTAKETLDLQEYANGLYFFQCTDFGITEIYRVVVNN